MAGAEYFVKSTLMKGEPKPIKKVVIKDGQEVTKVSDFVDIVGYVIGRSTDNKVLALTKEEAAKFILSKDPVNGTIANAKVCIKQSTKNPANASVYLQGVGLSLKDKKMLVNILDASGNVKQGFEKFKSVTARTKSTKTDNTCCS